MRVPLTTRDFLDRAELVYGDRVGIVDEPNQPAPSLGDVTYRDVARRGRALQAGLDGLGIAEGERVAIVSQK
jgi:fatty-acyl-CoA synthase